MFDTETLQTLLNLPDIAIDRVVLTERKTLKIYVHSTLEGTECHRCDKPIDHDYGLGQEINLRHLPLFDYTTVIVLRPKRYQCRHCSDRPTTSQTTVVVYASGVGHQGLRKFGVRSPIAHLPARA
ncbi:hypothetical protein ThidrDRAFT_4558 [Thiorhodococcus drewsii AZ1]|uniref:Uncharacterized protein n=1 Tax=Thiorhodococcus drewsii AZ1 TaxID=765913 RepID=G2E8E4_9GAMM|nr:hypothetical protein ThidrDRAFT_4558 [Thiorhodococcus drewsii AZ1]